MIGCSRAAERGLLRGIVRYSRFHGPWILYREPPFYRKPPYHKVPKQAKTSTGLRVDDFEGIIAFAANRAQLATFVRPGFPSVVLPIEQKIPGYCSIGEEAHVVGRMAAEHFLGRGFTRFAFCGFDHMYWSRVRQEGFTQRLTEAGCAVHLYEPPGSPARMSWEAELTSMADWLKSLPKPIALMACNDDRAQQVAEANKAAEIRMPDEISILGVDNDDMICELTNPTLSSIALNHEEVGYEAAAQLDRQMRGRRFSAEQIYLRPTYIHIRQSTDVLATGDPVVAKAIRFIRGHAGQALSVDDVAQAVSTSRRLLERHFRQAVGASAYQEILRARIERACQMLVETTWSLTEIARQCGFSSPVHLGVAFKRQMGLTPQQHRGKCTRPAHDPRLSRSALAKDAHVKRGYVAKSKGKDAKSNTFGGPNSR